MTPHIVKRFSITNSNSILITNYPIIDPNDNIVRNPNKAICLVGGISPQWNHDIIINAIEKLMVNIFLPEVKEEYLESNETTRWCMLTIGKVPHQEVKKYTQAIAGIALNDCNQAR